MKYEDILNKAENMAAEWKCPECEATMQQEDDDVVVCPSCHYSAEIEDLEEVWEEKIIAEEGIDNEFEDEDDWSEEDDEDDDGEGLSVYDAALIWASRGKDEDYTFGYTEEELEEALR